MSLVELVLVSVGLAMDAFAVSICKGLSLKEMSYKGAVICGVYFGGFQVLMPVAGYLLGSGFKDLIADFDHWIAFGLLALIGISMIRESRSEVKRNSDFGPRTMIPLAVATSIDAMAVGVSFAFLRVNLAPAVTLIGAITFIISFCGVKIGNIFGARYRARAEVLGGMILIAIGTKILLEHLGVLPW